MKKISIIIYILVCIVFTFAQNDSQSQCIVTGKIQTNEVLDKSNDGIPYSPTNLVFKNNIIDKMVRTDDSGNYKIILPNGVYEVSVKTLYDTIFYRRATFDCQDKIAINIYPLWNQVSYGIVSTGPMEHQIETLGKEWTRNNKLNIVIAYLSKKRKKGLTSYQGNVYLTFDKYCLFAGEVIKDEKKKTLTAESFTWIEDGIERKKIQKVILDFSKDEIKPFLLY